jgi:hypothetical protein
VGWIHDLIDRRLHKRYMGELVEDEIVRSSGGMIVRSCRPKLHWNPYMTVEYQGEFFQMIRERRARVRAASRITCDATPSGGSSLRSKFYELFRQEEIEGPRNFLYFLRKAPPNKPAPVIRHYKIDDVLSKG